MSLFNWPLLVTAFLLGMGLGIQAPINAWIGKRLGSPYWGAGFSISISLVVILLFVFIMVRTIPSAKTIWNAPWWVWLGGIFGAMFVARSNCAWAEDGDGPVFHLCCFWSGFHFLVD